MNRYQQRDSVLRTMGFASYADYLASALWKRIRARIFKVYDKCVCGAPATQCHHRSYKRRYLEGRGKIHKFITPLCRECHSAIEFEGSEKLSLGWANSKLDAIRADAELRGIRAPGKTRTRPSKASRKSDYQARIVDGHLQDAPTLNGKPSGENGTRTQCHVTR